MEEEIEQFVVKEDKTKVLLRLQKDEWRQNQQLKIVQDSVVLKTRPAEMKCYIPFVRMYAHYPSH